VSTDTKGYLVVGWLFGTFGGVLVVAGAFYAPLGDESVRHTVPYLFAGVALLVAGVLSAVALAIGARTPSGRLLALAGTGAPVFLALLALVAQ
jgi:hypothetical protein